MFLTIIYCIFAIGVLLLSSIWAGISCKLFNEIVNSSARVFPLYDWNLDSKYSPYSWSLTLEYMTEQDSDEPLDIFLVTTHFFICAVQGLLTILPWSCMAIDFIRNKFTKSETIV